MKPLHECSAYSEDSSEDRDDSSELTFPVTLSEFNFDNPAVESNAVHRVSGVLRIANGLELVTKLKLRGIVQSNEKQLKLLIVNDRSFSVRTITRQWFEKTWVNSRIKLRE